MKYISKIYTVESVTSGHPDKICDQISDAVLDECLRQDPKSRVAVETFGSHGLLIIGGEVTTNAEVDFEKIGRELYQALGYKDDLRIITNIVKQSPDIAQGVDTGGAGDQGIMYGYATRETPEFLPKGVVLVHKLTQGLEKLRRNAKISWLRPDGKAQVTIGNPEIKTILVSCQHEPQISQEEIRQTLIDKLIKPLVDSTLRQAQGKLFRWIRETRHRFDSGQASSRQVGDIYGEHSRTISGIEILVNPTGKFIQGGFEADTGLTGRKIMVDTYGGLIPHGGGCFSGKDPTKVDRSAAYMARFAAKNIVANGLARRCLVSVAYAIGKAEPLMVEAINEKGESLSDFVKEKFDFRPGAIIERLALRQPIYRQTAAYGHFGKPHLPWEKIIEL